VKRLRVLVVDDSAVIRKLVSDAIAGSPDLELSASAPNGKVALERLAASLPDLVTLDVEMPVMGGIETLKALKKLHPKLPVLMFSSHTERGALATLDALGAGASDFVAKPQASGPEEARAFVEREVLPRLRALGQRLSEAKTEAPSPPPRPAAPPPQQRHKVEVVVIGVSTGGPQALERVLPKLPRNLAVPVLVVQHMPTLFTRLLAERLALLGPLPVREAKGGEPLGPGSVLIAPGGHHLLVGRHEALPMARLGEGPPENSCRPAADVLFRSAVEVYGPGVLAVVLTGMGRDGTAGCEAVRGRGGAVLAQDRESSTVWGMPGAVVAAGLADQVVPLDEVATEIAVRVSRGQRAAAREAR
jgi:two-component system chemotaxis response regulator CheB